jgi:putative transposase
MRVSYEAIRQWSWTFGQHAANPLRRRRPGPGDTGHPDEVFRTTYRQHHDLWQAVDQEAHVLDMLIQQRCDTGAAKPFFRKVLEGLACAPRVVVTDQPKSYGAAMLEVMPCVEHRQDREVHKRAEHSH